MAGEPIIRADGATRRDSKVARDSVRQGEVMSFFCMVKHGIIDLKFITAPRQGGGDYLYNGTFIYPNLFFGGMFMGTNGLKITDLLDLNETIAAPKQHL